MALATVKQSYQTVNCWFDSSFIIVFWELNLYKEMLRAQLHCSWSIALVTVNKEHSYRIMCMPSEKTESATLIVPEKSLSSYFQKSSILCIYLLCPHTEKIFFMTFRHASLLLHFKYIISHFHYGEVSILLLFMVGYSVFEYCYCVVPALNLPLQNKNSVQPLLLSYARQSTSTGASH